MAGQLGDFSGAARLWGAAREQEESSVPGETNPARGKAGCRMGPFPAAPSGLGMSFGHEPCKMWAPEPSNAQGWAERGKKREAEAAKAPSAPAQHRSRHLLAASPPALPSAGWGRGGGRTPSSSWHLLAWGLFIREHRKLNRSLSLSLSLPIFSPEWREISQTPGSALCSRLSQCFHEKPWGPILLSAPRHGDKIFPVDSSAATLDLYPR